MRINIGTTVFPALRLTLVASLLLLSGCQTAYYAGMEKLGVEKREIFASRMLAAKSAQGEAKEQFVDALESFRQVVNFDGGNLESAYNKLKAQYERSSAKAAKVSSRIDSVEQVSKDMFKEWRNEITQFKTEGLKAKSQARYEETSVKYDTLMEKMRMAEESMEPVLQAFNDRVLYLKHNLNAAAVSSLRGELVDIEDDVTNLIGDMDSAIREADEFLAGY